MNVNTGGGGGSKTNNEQLKGIKRTAYYNNLNKNQVANMFGYTPSTTSSTPTTNYSYSGGGYSSGGGDYSAGDSWGGGGGYYDPYQAYLEEQRRLEEERQRKLREATDRANNLLKEQAKLLTARYEGYIPEIKANYQDLMNQRSVNYFKNKANVREALANRGALDSGVGRMETLKLGTDYSNDMNKIGMQRENEIQGVRNAIADMLLEVAMQQASNEANYAAGGGTLASNVSVTPYKYSPTTSQYYNTVNQLANNSTNLTPAITNGVLSSGASNAVRANYLNEEDYLGALRDIRKNI